MNSQCKREAAASRFSCLWGLSTAVTNVPTYFELFKGAASLLKNKEDA